MQMLPHEPQLFTLFWVLVSQPLAGLASQLVKPEWQVVYAQAPVVQLTPSAFFTAVVQSTRVAQLAPQEVSAVSVDSQPFEATRSQS